MGEIHRFEKDKQLHKVSLEYDPVFEDIKERAKKIDRSVVQLQHDKVIKQMQECLTELSAQGLLPWECIMIVEDITKEALDEWTAAHKEESMK